MNLDLRVVNSAASILTAVVVILNGFFTSVTTWNSAHVLLTWSLSHSSIESLRMGDSIHVTIRRRRSMIAEVERWWRIWKVKIAESENYRSLHSAPCKKNVKYMKSTILVLCICLCSLLCASKRSLMYKRNYKEQGRIHGYPSRVRVGRSCIGSHLIIWAGAVRP